MEPVLNLSERENRYWHVLKTIQTTTWDDADCLVASAMCRNLALLEEICRDDVCDDLMPEIVMRVAQGVKLLKLKSRVTGTQLQEKIVGVIVEAV